MSNNDKSQYDPPKKILKTVFAATPYGMTAKK